MGGFREGGTVVKFMKTKAGRKQMIPTKDTILIFDDGSEHKCVVTDIKVSINSAPEMEVIPRTVSLQTPIVITGNFTLKSQDVKILKRLLHDLEHPAPDMEQLEIKQHAPPFWANNWRKNNRKKRS